MIDISGHLRDYRSDFGYQNNEKNLVINCCGMQQFITQNFSVARPAGRFDYQLIYIEKGCGHFYINEQWKCLSAGNLILYRPKEAQNYYYEAQEAPKAYWIHFTGSKCEDILGHLQTQSEFIGECYQLAPICQEMIEELQLKKFGYESIVNANFIRLLAILKRTTLLNATQKKENFNIDRVIIQLHQNYMKPWTVKEMAKICDLGVDYFSHIFKKVQGQSPMQFLAQLRIEKAKELLVINDLTISTIANLVGYPDSLYFSRIFKKHTGQSPINFKKNL